MTTQSQFSKTISPESLNHLSVSYLVNSKLKRRGGTAGNIAFNLHLLLQDPLICGALGTDGDEYQEEIESWGLATDLLHRSMTQPTASAYILTDTEQAQVAFFHPGSMSETIDEIHFNEWPNALVHIAPDDVGKMKQYALTCKQQGIDYVFDPGQNLMWFETDDLLAIIPHAKAVIVNEFEYKLLQEKTNLNAEAIKEQCQLLIVTQGKKGSTMYRNGHDDIFVPSVPPKHEGDPTGCGDAYRAGILAGFKEGWSLELSGKVGAFLATATIEHEGTQEHSVEPAEIEAFVGEKILS